MEDRQGLTKLTHYSDFKVEEKPFKKEFITTWELCPIYTEKAPQSAESFFQVVHRDFDTKVDAVLPNDISFRDLYSLTGKKTKVTIEVLPW